MKIRFNNLLSHVKKVDSSSAPSNLLCSLDNPNCTIHKLNEFAEPSIEPRRRMH